MDRAVSQLDAYLQSKTTHATSALIMAMQALSTTPHLFDSVDEQQAFGQTCRNFEIASEQLGKTSWGRNQFEHWWNAQMGTSMNEPQPEPLPEMPEGYTDIYEANLRIAELEHQIQEMRWAFQRIQSIAGDNLK